MCSSATSSRNIPSRNIPSADKEETNFGNQEENSNSDLPECLYSDDPGADSVVEDPISLDQPPIVIDSETSSVCTCSYACMI